MRRHWLLSSAAAAVLVLLSLAPWALPSSAACPPDDGSTTTGTTQPPATGTPPEDAAKEKAKQAALAKAHKDLQDLEKRIAASEEKLKEPTADRDAMLKLGRDAADLKLAGDATDSAAAALKTYGAKLGELSLLEGRLAAYAKSSPADAVPTKELSSFWTGRTGATEDDDPTLKGDVTKAGTDAADLLNRVSELTNAVKADVEQHGVRDAIRTKLDAYAATVYDSIALQTGKLELSTLTEGAEEPAARAALLASLARLGELEKLSGQLDDACHIPQIGSILEQEKTRAARTSLAEARKTAAGNVPGCIKAIREAALKAVEDTRQTTTTVRAALLATPRRTGEIDGAAPKLPRLRVYAEQLSQIGGGLPSLLSGWVKQGCIGNDVPGQWDAVTPVIASLGDEIGLLADALAGDVEHFVQEQVRLYYFTDVERILRALSGDGVHWYPADGKSPRQSAVEKAREDLLSQEGDAADLSMQLRQLKDQVSKDREELRQANAEMRDLDARIRFASRRQETLARITPDDATITKLGEEKTSLDGKLKTAEDDLAAMEKERARLIEKRDGETDRELAREDNVLVREQDARIRTKAADVADIRRRRDAVALRLNAANQTKSDITTQAGTSASYATDLLTEKTALETRRTELKTRIQELPARLRASEDALFQKQVERARVRRQVAELAAQEAQAFGEAQASAPFMYTTPSAAAGDPAKRIFIFGYSDSKTILLRGLANDVRRVKEIIAGFDRPAPQARITLWTLQMNADGGGGPQMNRALTGVDKTLRDLRANIAMVQDSLRNCVMKEVNRVAYIGAKASNVSAPDPPRFTERMARYFYYAPEVRSSLGFRYAIPSNVERLEAMHTEIRLAREAYLEAKKAHRAVAQSDGRADMQARHRAERRAYLEKAAWHAGLARTFLRRLSGPAHSQVNELDGDVQELLKTIDEFALLMDAPLRDCEKDADRDRGYDRIFELKPSGGRIPTLVPTSPVPFERDGVCTAIDSLYAKIGTMRQMARLDADKWPPTAEDVADTEYLTRWTLPDPAGTTTLGETLFVLSLGGRESRERIIHDFMLELSKLAPEAGKSPADRDKAQGADLTGLVASLRAFLGESVPGPRRAQLPPAQYPLLPRAVLGATESMLQGEDRPYELTANQGEDMPYELTANQREILSALLAKAQQSTAAQLRQWLRDAGQGADLGSARSPTPLGVKAGPLLGWLHYRATPRAIEGDRSSGTGGPTQKAALWSTLGHDAVADTTQGSKDGAAPPGSRDAVWETGWGRAWLIAERAGLQNSLAGTAPRVAAADDMIKRLIIMAESDLDYFFVAPALEDLQTAVRQPNVRLGTIQRESILATNRLVARVDPRASADMTLAGGTDFLAAAQQLGQLADRVRETRQGASRTNQLANMALGSGSAALAGAGIQSLAYGGVLSVLASLDNRPADPPGEIYAVSTGSLFKVTPVFDPSGQALRFRFDYSGSTLVQEPSGGTDPDLPRVDRHTVNTEVQLTNLEIREVSRFESNTKIGLPPARSGGIPLLNKVPIIRDIPIVGYFYRRDAQKAVSQQSLIFAQTSIYPTISDIMDLMTETPPVIDLDPLPPGTKGTNK